MVEGLTGIKTIQALVVNEQKQFEHVSNQVRNSLLNFGISAMVEPFMKG